MSLLDTSDTLAASKAFVLLYTPCLNPPKLAPKLVAIGISLGFCELLWLIDTWETLMVSMLDGA